MKIVLLLEDQIAANNYLSLKNITEATKQNEHYIEVWDLRFVLGLQKRYKNIMITNEDFKIKTFGSSREIISALKNEKDTIFISTYRLTQNNLFFYQELKKLDFKYFVLKNKSHPLTDSVAELRYRSNRIKKYFINKIHQKLNKLYFKNFSNINIPNLIILGTKNDKNLLNFPCSEDKIIYTHNNEYDKQIFINKSNVSKNHILFVDQYLPYHPELITEKINAYQYYNKINTFLLKISLQLKTPAVVSVHPIGDITKIEPYFSRNIALKRNETPKLINSAKLIIGHSSTALIQAIVLGKPFILITSNHIKNTSIHRGTVALAKILKLEVINIDDENIKKNILENTLINTDRIFNKYIKHKNTPDLYTWEVISKILNTIK